MDGSLVSALNIRHFCCLSPILLLLALTGCGTLNVYVPGPMIEGPDLSEKAEIAFGAEPTTRYEYTSDASNRPPTLNNPEVKTGTFLSARGGYNVLPWLELGLKMFPGGAYTFIGGLGGTARAQVLGDNKSPGLCATVYGGVFYNSSRASGDQKGEFGPGGYNWNAEARASTRTAGFTLGYRTESKSIIFVAASYADQEVGGSIHHDLSSDSTSPAADYTLDNLKGSTRAVALGARFGEKVMLQIDARHLSRSWPGFATSSRGGGAQSETLGALSLIFR